MSSARKNNAMKPARSPSASSKKQSNTKNAKSGSSSQPSVLERLQNNSKGSKPFGNISVRAPNSPKKSARSESRKKSHSPKSEKSRTEKDKGQDIFNVESILEPIKPKQPSSAYIFFARQYTLKANVTSVKEANDAMTAAGKEWNALTDEQKEPYKQEASKDHDRFKREQAQYEETGFFINSDGVKSTELAMLKRNFKYNVTKPKQISSPYIMFIKKQYATKKNSMSGTGLEGLKLSQSVLTSLAKDWTELSDKKKAAYKKLSGADQIRYDREMQQLLTQGYFIREDGTRSQNNRKLPKEATSVGSKRQKEHVEAETASKRLKK